MKQLGTLLLYQMALIQLPRPISANSLPTWCIFCIAAEACGVTLGLDPVVYYAQDYPHPSYYYYTYTLKHMHTTENTKLIVC